MFHTNDSSCYFRRRGWMQVNKPFFKRTYRIDFGPGYRIYFARDGEQVIILLGGGTKKKQQRDIALAVERWHDYKRRRKLGEANGLD